MAGIDLQALRTAIKARLDAAGLSDFNGRKVAVFAYESDAGVQYPCIIIRHKTGGEIDYLASYTKSGLAMVPLQLEVRCLAANVTDGEIALDRLLAAGSGAASSVFDAMFTTDPSFGGLIDDGTTLTCSSPGKFTDGESVYWAATFEMTVYVRKG